MMLLVMIVLLERKNMIVQIKIKYVIITTVNYLFINTKNKSVRKIRIKYIKNHRIKRLKRLKRLKGLKRLKRLKSIKNQKKKIPEKITGK